MDTQTKRAIVRVSRLILGALFIFSGLTKCIDPMGGAIKVEDYFVAWGWDGMPWWVCMALSTIQNILEFSTGFMLFCGAFIEVSSAIALSFMVFFTPLTLYIAIANPVSDCGCFGDAFKITNWQTFGKNVFFLAVAIVVFVWRKVEAHDTKRWRQLVMTVTGITVASLITIKGITDEPIIDFRPYAVGTDINASMSIPEGAPQTEYKTTFILEKDGQLKEFDENTYPYDDPTWVYKDTRSEIIKEGYVPPITDFTFTTEDGDLMTDSLLHSSQPIILALSVKLENASDTALATLAHQKTLADNNGFKFYLATSSNNFTRAKQLVGPDTQILTADETMLKTMARSNPALIVLQDGVVVAKYSVNHLPFDDEMATPAASYLANLKHSYDWMVMVCLTLACVIVWLLIRGGKRRRTSQEDNNLQ